MFVIEEELKKLPAKPGVYIMHDDHDNILYVGKAIVLKNRVRQYFQSSRNLTPKIQKMVSLVSWFEYIVTDSELEALVLENNLIKEHRPKYNTMLKDDKTYPYIKVTTAEAYPRILLTRQMKKDKAKYFGPYTSVQSVRDTIDLLQKIYHIRNCSRVLPKDTGKERPCLYHHMGQCDAPCQGWVSEEAYKESIKEVIHFLNGHFEPVITMLTDKMTGAAAELDFEKAAAYRDLLSSVKQIDQKQKITSADQEDRDIIACAIEEDEAVVQVFFIRGGKLLGREHFYVTGVKDDEPGEILGAFVKQYYASAPFIPAGLMLQHTPKDAALIEEWLTMRREHRVKLIVPQKGQKEKMVELAAQNAAIVLNKDKEKIKLEEARTIGAVGALSDMLALPQIFRMEAFDISNISGVETVGSMIVYENGKPRRNAYRKFRIRTVKGQDDYKCMEEVLLRRFTHGLQEQEGREVNGTGFAAFPDVLMMDGGKGQVGVAERVLKELDLAIPVCGMVKDDHHRTRGLYYKGEELPIDKYSEVFKLITRMQDEAHRFAIEYHRSLRSKSQVKSLLDEIEGIGPARRKALMAHFGDIVKIREASEEEIRQVPGMTAAAARSVYQYFH